MQIPKISAISFAVFNVCVLFPVSILFILILDIPIIPIYVGVISMAFIFFKFNYFRSSYTIPTSNH